MKENGKKVHVLKDPKLKLIRYNFRAILSKEYDKRINELMERSKELSERKRNGEISYREWKNEMIKMRKESVALQDALAGNPIICMECKSVKNDLQQDKLGGWECYNEEHELDERGLPHPTSPFDENLVLWKGK
ncbi:MAG: hypothetical protein BAJALOKI2v1_70068 [Promethearchaeota archaeon]|nr:MAG: hypothetical protein BAJALOKI2v1_70068 [Candidatus Lokiarchaeota archaeon]